MSVELSEAYVLGLLSDAEPAVNRLEKELGDASQRAASVDAELITLLDHRDGLRRELAQGQTDHLQTTTRINRLNMDIASRHQDVATLTRRGDDIRLEMDRVADEPQLRRRLRRERAKLKVQIEDREADIERLRAEVAELRERLATVDTRVTALRDRLKDQIRALDALQGQLPDPHLHARLFEYRLATAHGLLFLDGDAEAWRRAIRRALEAMTALHQDLRAGKYRLDKNSELVAGRSTASAEAVYAAVAIGDLELAGDLFDLITSPDLMFHDIFNVFRVWCLGLLIRGRREELWQLLRRHQFSAGLRGAYVNAFIGLAGAEVRRLRLGLRDMVRHEWELWQAAERIRGAGVVNLGALAISRLALGQNLHVPIAGPTVPEIILVGPRPAPSIRASI